MKGGPEGIALATAARALVVADLAGFAWLDSDLSVRRTEGALAAGIPVGHPIGHGMPALWGLDADILSLRGQPGQRLDLPNIAIATPGGTGPRLNLHVLWQPDSDGYLVVLGRAIGQDELARDLAEQSRRRQIAEAAQIEQAAAIERVNRELQRANGHLAEFADIISHDLRAPLRGLRYHVEDLEEAIAKGDAVAAFDLVGRLQRQSRRMTDMLSGLMEYARAGRDEDVVAPVDTRALVEVIVGSLPRPPALAIDISGDWPVVELAAAPLDLVLRNLVDNAIKHHDAETGCIGLHAAPAAGALHIKISDDGPGIPRRFHETVFMPFRTLHPAGADKGSGLGLALVRRLVEAAGATIALHSDPERAPGTAFHVTWPLRR